VDDAVGSTANAVASATDTVAAGHTVASTRHTVACGAAWHATIIMNRVIPTTMMSQHSLGAATIRAAAVGGRGIVGV